ncbi:MAG: sugar phosphate nucleotidyltransferase [Gaiellaceae bacterium]
MQALILVGGEGTRLRPLTLTVPKPVVPLVDRPFIRYMIEWLARHGVDDIVMASGFLAAGVRDVLGEGGDGGPRLRYVEEPEVRGTAGAMKFAERFLDDRFLALNGDVLTDLDLSALIELHDRRNAEATLALYAVDDPSGYGVVRLEEGGEIIEFLEKPDPDDTGTVDINAGAYVLERSVLDRIPDGREVSIEREVFPELAEHGLHGLRLPGYWMDIGTPERYLQASWDILERRVETEVAERLDDKGLFVDPGARMSDRTEVTAPGFIESHTSIGADGRVGPLAVIGPGCEIAEDVAIERSALLRGCRLGTGARVTGAILAAGVEVGSDARVGDGAVVGEGARIAPGVEVPDGDRVDPAASVG